MALMDPRSNELIAAKIYSASIIGATSTTTTRIWIRVYQAGDWLLVLSKTPFAGDLIRLQEKTVAQFLADNGIAPVFIESNTFGFETNLTHTFTVGEQTPLQADTAYYYALMTDDRKVERRTEIGYDLPKCFRTMPLAPTVLTFGFYSCHDHISDNGSFGAWPHLLNQLNDSHAHYVIGGGDQIYVDTDSQAHFPDIWKWLKENKDDLLKTYSKGKKTYDTDGIYNYLLDIYRWFYRVYWQVPPLQRVYERYPQFMMWDDHEIMDGWGSYSSKERLEVLSRWFQADDTKNDKMLIDLMWRAACRAYYEYEHSHNPPTQYDPNNPNNCVWDYNFKVGKTATYMLDMRGHHDIEKDVKKDPYRILGKEQLNRFIKWLSAECAASAHTLFVVSPVPVLHWVDALVNYADLGGAKDDFQDEWDHETNQFERAELLNAAFTNLDAKGKTLVFLSGDVHCASVFKLTHKKFRAAKVFQVTSSAISRKPAPTVSLVGITSGGALTGCKDVRSERLFALTGNKNFAMLKVRQLDTDHDEVTVDLCWPGGEEGEITRKSIVLK